MKTNGQMDSRSGRPVVWGEARLEGGGGGCEAKERPAAALAWRRRRLGGSRRRACGM